MKYLQSQDVNIDKDKILKLIAVLNTGIEDRIICATETDHAKNELIISITHLQFQEDHPFIEKIKAYQHRRTIILSKNQFSI